MTVQEAYTKIEAVLKKYADVFAERELKTAKSIVYMDKNLIESEEFTVKSVLIYGNLSVGIGEMGLLDYCSFAVGAEITTGLVDEAKLDEAIREFDEELGAFIERISAVSGAVELEALLNKISEEQQKDAEEAALDFAKEMKKVKRKMMLGIGAIVVILIAVLVLVPLL